MGDIFGTLMSAWTARRQQQKEAQAQMEKALAQHNRELWRRYQAIEARVSKFEQQRHDDAGKVASKRLCWRCHSEIANDKCGSCGAHGTGA